jgi:hypothetical protein
MTAIAIKAFGGVAPAMSAKALPEPAGQQALNCSFFSGSLKPVSPYDVSAPEYVFPAQLSYNYRTLYRWQVARTTSSTTGYGWIGTILHLALVPGLDTRDDSGAETVDARLYATQYQRYDIGSGESLDLPWGLYCTLSEHILEDRSVTPEVPSRWYQVGVTKPGAPPEVALLDPTSQREPQGDATEENEAANVENAVYENRVYVYTYVSGWYEESAPSGVSDDIRVALGDEYTQQGVRVIVDTTPLDATDPSKPQSIRIYRSAYGGFLFVAEVSPDPESGSQFTYDDRASSELLGEQMPSLTWTPPPADLRNLTSLPNGLMAGSTARTVWFCEPYRPFAWPLGYTISVDHRIVALGRIDTTLVVLTEGTPYLIQGSDPSGMVSVKVDLEQACLAPRSVVSYGGTVVYVAPDGLMSVAPNGSKLVTEGRFDRASWQLALRILTDDTNSGVMDCHKLVAAQHDQMYFLFGSTGGLIYNYRTGDISYHNYYADAVFQDLYTDELYIMRRHQVDADNIRAAVYRWAAITAEYTWMSKRYTFPQAIGFTCGNIDAAYDGTNGVTITILANTNHAARNHGTMVEVMSITVYDMGMFRLPAVQARDWEIRLQGSIEVFAVTLAQSPAELANV